MKAHAPLGRVVSPVVGFAHGRTVQRKTGLHLPSHKEIGAAHAAWRRRQSFNSGAYFDQPMTSPATPTPATNERQRHNPPPRFDSPLVC